MPRALPIILLVVFLLAGVAYFLITARLVGRHLLADLPEPNAFAGPEVLNGYTLSRGLRGPESFIEDPAGNPVMPASDLVAHAGVVRLGIVGAFILGELADLESGESRGFFLIDTVSGEVRGPHPEGAWRHLAGERIKGEPPELQPADSFTGPAGTP